MKNLNDLNRAISALIDQYKKIKSENIQMKRQLEQKNSAYVELKERVASLMAKLEHFEETALSSILKKHSMHTEEARNLFSGENIEKNG